MVAVPAAMPQATPVPDPIVTIAVFELVHHPPGTRSLSVVQLPGQSENTPVIGAGVLLTVITLVV